MTNSGQSAKHRKIELTYQVIKRYPNGVTEREIADELNMSDKRRTINNYLRALESEGKIYKEEHSTLWFALPYESVKLRGLELSPEETMTLYLAVRLLVKQHDKRNAAAQLALTKLAEVLTGDAGVGHEIYQAALELTHRPGDEGYARIFRTMMQAYIYRRKVALTYKPLNEDPFETTFSPYLFEPSAIGYATYVIGHSTIVDDQRTYKLQRIQSATLTREEYVIPYEFPGLEILRNAWSIIHGNKLIPVKLRFSPKVAERVRESQWHPSQDPVVDDPNRPGWVIWSAQVADLTDLTPWVRSWGSSVEILVPEELRKSLMDETKRLALLYEVGNITPPPLHQKLWAKTDRSTGKTHPLICHMLDVAQVTLALWHNALTESIRQQFARLLSLDEESAGRLIAFWAGLHDLGKATPAFQRKWQPAEIELKHAGLDFPEVFTQEPFYHATASTKLLPDLLKAETGLSSRLARGVAHALGGHHGVWPTPRELQDFKDYQLGDDSWQAVQPAIPNLNCARKTVA